MFGRFRVPQSASVWFFAACLCVFGSAISAECSDIGSSPSASLSTGSGTFVFTGSAAAENRPVTVWYHRPRSWKASNPIVFVMHGDGRRAQPERAAWIPSAERYNLLLIVPEFSRGYYPQREQYHQGNVLRPDGTPIDTSEWSFTTVEKIFDDVKRRTASTRAAYWIAGHSAGGQFVHRMLLLARDARIDKAVVENAGFYTMPTLEAPYPYGLGKVLDEVRAVANIKVAFAREVTVLLGEEDTKLTPGVKQTSEAMEQGAHRFERGDAFFETARRQAQKLEVPFRWLLRTVPGVGHGFRSMAPSAAEALVKPGS